MTTILCALLDILVEKAVFVGWKFWTAFSFEKAVFVE